MITHRCKESLAQRVSIRYTGPYSYYNPPNAELGWQVFKAKYDNDTFTWWMPTLLNNIHYCPFCGKRLRDPIEQRLKIKAKEFLSDWYTRTHYVMPDLNIVIQKQEEEAKDD